MGEKNDRRERQAVQRLDAEYAELKQQLLEIGFALQGSLTERWMECGKATCACREDDGSRHGPYFQWSWKVGGKTKSVFLNPEQAMLCKEWIANNRRLERIVKRMRSISLRMSQLRGIKGK